MMKRVYKYQLRLTDRQFVGMPAAAQILCAQTQFGDLCLWALVDPDATPIKRVIRIHGTGHDIDLPELLKYIGTVQFSAGSLVFHVFEECC